jgi:hypothetical protein
MAAGALHLDAVGRPPGRVAAHGGRVAAESAGKGQGSCFMVSLPVADA